MNRIKALPTGVIISLLFLIALTVDARESDAEVTNDAPPESELEEWRATLQFGINEELLDLLPQLTSQKVEELEEDIVVLFENSPSTSVIQGCLDYLTAIESYAARDASLEKLERYEDLSADLVQYLLTYLKMEEPDLNRRERNLIEEIAAQRRTPEIVPSALRLLAADGEDASFFIELYEDEENTESIQGEILLALGEIGDSTAFDFVSDVLSENEATTMLERFAIDTLGRLGDERAIPILIRQFDADDALTRAYAVSALKNFTGRDVDSAILSALRDDFWRVRVAALETIAEREISDAESAVIYKMRRDPEEKVRLEAGKTLTVLDSDEGWDAIYERAASPRTPAAERAALLEHLAKEDPSRALEIMIEIADTEWDRENSELLDLVGRIISTEADKSFEPLYIRFLAHKNFILQIYALRGIGRAGISSLREDVELRTDESYHRAVRSAALRALDEL